jgi:tartrate dehydrogenase/decarboxylase / D-malate dehydrogenase
VTHRVAVLAGDGVGPEVVAEARKAVDAVGVAIEWTEYPWGSAHWHEHGRMMPVDATEYLRTHDAILMGAMGDPSVPDDVSLWGSILGIRQSLDLWANIRPCRLLPGIPGPLAGRSAGDFDILFVRENTEGEYSGAGGIAHRGLASEIAVEAAIFTRAAIERVVRHAFELAAARRGILTSATKSNASRYGYVLWDEICEEEAAQFPGVRYERVLVDALAARMVHSPESLDVVVASNLFADILTDLAAAIQGGMGMAASANLAPGADVPGLFEPVHGSAPDIAGQGIANPAGAVWSASLMLGALGEPDAASALMEALEDICRDGPRTRDVGGSATTREVGDAIAARVAT